MSRVTLNGTLVEDLVAKIVHKGREEVNCHRRLRAYGCPKESCVLVYEHLGVLQTTATRKSSDCSVFLPVLLLPRLIGSLRDVYEQAVAAGVRISIRTAVRWSYQLMKVCIYLLLP